MSRSTIKQVEVIELDPETHALCEEIITRLDNAGIPYRFKHGLLKTDPNHTLERTLAKRVRTYAMTLGCFIEPIRDIVCSRCKGNIRGKVIHVHDHATLKESIFHERCFPKAIENDATMTSETAEAEWWEYDSGLCAYCVRERAVYPVGTPNICQGCYERRSEINECTTL